MRLHRQRGAARLLPGGAIDRPRHVLGPRHIGGPILSKPRGCALGFFGSATGSRGKPLEHLRVVRRARPQSVQRLTCGVAIPFRQDAEVARRI